MEIQRWDVVRVGPLSGSEMRWHDCKAAKRRLCQQKPTSEQSCMRGRLEFQGSELRSSFLFCPGLSASAARAPCTQHDQLNLSPATFTTGLQGFAMLLARFTLRISL